MSVHCKDGNTWSTKLERIGTLALSKPETVFNNLGHIINIDMLRELYQELDGKKAVGIDGVSKEEYGEKLERNLEDLLKRIRRGTYKPKPSRIVEIPKEDGSTRPLAISCIEDKLAQSAVSTILGKIYEPIFLPCSYGFRPKQNCHDALRALVGATDRAKDGAILEIDIQKYFNTIPHEILLECVKKKVSDSRFLHLILELIRAPIKTGNIIEANKIGCPQGSIISPILANIYLHYAIDTWFEEIRETHIKGRAEQVRYADDMVFVFERKEEAKRFFEVLPKRLEKYGLKLHPDKTRIIGSGSKAAQAAVLQNKKLDTYQFLGFTCYWGLSRDGKFWRLKYRSRADRFKEKLKNMRKYLRKHLNANTEDMLKQIARVVRGWVNYHRISDNEHRVHTFIARVTRTLHWWMNRRGGGYTNWQQLVKQLKAVNFPSKWKTISMFPRVLKRG